MTSKMGRSVHILLLLACATNAFMAPRSARHMRSVLSAAVPDDCAVDDPRPECRDDNPLSTLDGFASQKVFNKGPLPTPVVFEVPDDCDVNDPRPECREDWGPEIGADTVEGFTPQQVFNKVRSMFDEPTPVPDDCIVDDPRSECTAEDWGPQIGADTVEGFTPQKVFNKVRSMFNK
eukprot:FR734653.1.p1 GENE.FR734653.1~~FR734653.1.p1  ORF type:complete len:206 (+),score=25.13 FR734653.1:89-619(+)